MSNEVPLKPLGFLLEDPDVVLDRVHLYLGDTSLRSTPFLGREEKKRVLNETQHLSRVIFCRRRNPSRLWDHRDCGVCFARGRWISRVSAGLCTLDLCGHSLTQ